MEDQQQTENVSKELEKPLSELSGREVAERMVDAKRTIRAASAYYGELEAEFVKRVPHKEFITVDLEVEVDGSVVAVPVTVQHKVRSGYTYNEEQVIRELKRHVPNPTIYINTEKVERLNREAFEHDVFKYDDMEALRQYPKYFEKSGCEVRGLPK